MTDLFQTTCPCCGQPTPDDQQSPFETFWQSIPKGKKFGNKQAAQRAWKKLTPADQQIASEKLTIFYALTKEERIGAQNMHISSFLNGRCWEEEVMEGKSRGHITSDSDILSYWSEQFKSDIPMESYELPTPGRIRELLEAGMITEEDVRRHT